MKKLALMALLSLSFLLACSGSLQPSEAPTSTVGRPPSKVMVVRPIEPAVSKATAPLQATPVRSSRLSPVLTMTAKRAAHSATLLPDGRVLIAGGFREEGTSEIPIASAEIYDPGTNRFLPIGDMNEARSGHTATLLPNGQVLIAGGWSTNGRTASTELFDPEMAAFRHGASMFAPRASMTATLLRNGRVLIAGGDSAIDTPQLTAELYDPAANSFLKSGDLNQGRSAHTATLLKDGTVLLIGGKPRDSSAGVLASAEIYDPKTGEFSYTGDMHMVRQKHAAVLLQDGRVLVVGGSNQSGWDGQYTSAEIYDPNKDAFRPVSDMNRERFKLSGAVVLMNNGDVLIGGGNRQIEIFDARKQRFIVGENVDDHYYYANLTLLSDGRVLITGGYDENIQPSEKAWIYNSY